MTITEMSLAGAVMILAVALIRAAAVSRLPKRTFVVLWELVLLRLLIPFSIPSVTSIYTLFAGSREAAAQTAQTAGYYISGALIQQDGLYIPRESAAQPFPVWTVIRLSVTALCAVGFAVMYLLAYRRFRYAEVLKDGCAVEWLEKQGIRRRVQIRLSDKVSSPLTFGIFRPVILLPSDIDTENKIQLEYILAHELTHIRRFDILRKLFAAAAVCVHWFNPAVWAMYLLFNRDIELACDEAVIRKSGSDCRSEYAGALIDMEEKRAKAPSLSAHFSKNAVEERISAIMKTGKIRIFTAVIACAVVAAVAGVFATSAYAGKPEPEYFTAPEYEAYTGYFIKTAKEPFLFIESGSGILDGNKLVCLQPEYPGADGDIFDGIATGNTVRITTDRCGGPPPFAAFVHSVEKLDDGIDINYAKISPVLELGYTVEMSVDECGNEIGLAYIMPPKEPETETVYEIIYTSTVEAALPEDIQAAGSEAVTVMPPDAGNDQIWAEGGGLTDGQRELLRSKYDVSKMKARVNGAYTREYLSFRDELVSMNIFTREQAERFFLVSVPAHTGVLNGPLGDTDIKEASNIVEELENSIEKQKELIAYISEKSQDPVRAQPEDNEYLEKAADIAVKLMLRDILYSLM